MSTIAERVAAGAAWLDENRPGWVERIDLQTLNLGDPCRCVLGQEYGSYGQAPDEPLGIGQPEDEIAAGLGFNAYILRGDYLADDFDFTPTVDEFIALTAEWRRLITARRVLTS